MSLQQRKDEIAAKRAKLEELKRIRQQRDRERFDREGNVSSQQTSVIGTPTRTSEDRLKLNELINSLVPESGRASRSGSPAAAGSRPSSIIGSGAAADASDTSTGTPSRQPRLQTSSIATQTFSDIGVSTTYEVKPAPRLEVVSYNVGVQTSDSWPLRPQERSTEEFSDSDLEDYPSNSRTPRALKRQSRREREREDELRQNLRREIEEELKVIRDSSSTTLVRESAQPRFPARPLTSDEMNAVTSSGEFLDFIDRSSKVIERALDQEYDILADYSMDGIDGLDDDDDEGYASARGRRGRKVKEVAQFFEEKSCRKRMISDINFSPKFPELLVASYTKNASAPQDPSGLLQVWNLHLHSRPEYTFHSSSDILSAKFSPFHPSLILGGCYSGQVLLWDTRSRSSLPVQKTPLAGASSGGHTHPIYNVEVVGTQNANNIISCSTDGVVCGWTIDMLAQPQEYLELVTPPPNKIEDLSPTCMAFPPSDPTSFLVGTEEGTIYPCHRYDRAGAKAGVDTRLRYKGHSAPVMSLNIHPARGPVDLSDLILTSSLDWSVKLWKIRPPSSTSTTTTAPSAFTGSLSAPNVQEIHPVMEFPREDVVYDARWSPQRPSVFALVDGAGSVEVWDLMADTEIPVAKASPSTDKNVTTLGGAYAPKSLNKLAWDEKEGKRLGVGGASGVVTVFEVGGALSGEGAKGEEWAGMKRLVGKMERAGR